LEAESSAVVSTVIWLICGGIEPGAAGGTIKSRDAESGESPQAALEMVKQH
jgi:hypothetical protein